MKEGRSAFKILTGTPAEKRPSKRPRRRWEKKIECILKEEISIRGIGLIRLRIGIIGSSYECGIESPGYVSHAVN